MPFKHYAVTLSGAVQRVSTALGLTEAAATLPYRQLIFSADPANTAVLYVGDSAVASTTHGFALDPTAATAMDKVSVGPFPSGAVKLQDFYVIGTANERLMIAGVPF
jgi:hypothetical protein